MPNKPNKSTNPKEITRPQLEDVLDEALFLLLSSLKLAEAFVTHRSIDPSDFDMFNINLRGMAGKLDSISVDLGLRLHGTPMLDDIQSDIERFREYLITVDDARPIDSPLKRL